MARNRSTKLAEILALMSSGKRLGNSPAIMPPATPKSIQKTKMVKRIISIALWVCPCSIAYASSPSAWDEKILSNFFFGNFFEHESEIAKYRLLIIVVTKAIVKRLAPVSDRGRAANCPLPEKPNKLTRKISTMLQSAL